MTFELYVQTLDEKRFTVKNLSSCSSVLDLKTSIFDASNIKKENQRLIFRGKVLSLDAETLNFYKISEQVTIQLVEKKDQPVQEPSPERSNPSHVSNRSNPHQSINHDEEHSHSLLSGMPSSFGISIIIPHSSRGGNFGSLNSLDTLNSLDSGSIPSNLLDMIFNGSSRRRVRRSDENANGPRNIMITTTTTTTTTSASSNVPIRNTVENMSRANTYLQRALGNLEDMPFLPATSQSAPSSSLAPIDLLKSLCNSSDNILDYVLENVSEGSIGSNPNFKKCGDFLTNLGKGMEKISCALINAKANNNNNNNDNDNNIDENIELNNNNENIFVTNTPPTTSPPKNAPTNSYPQSKKRKRKSDDSNDIKEEDEGKQDDKKKKKTNTNSNNSSNCGNEKRKKK